MGLICSDCLWVDLAVWVECVLCVSWFGLLCSLV